MQQQQQKHQTVYFPLNECLLHFLATSNKTLFVLFDLLSFTQLTQPYFPTNVGQRGKLLRYSIQLGYYRNFDNVLCVSFDDVKSLILFE